jgi:hypothetical protein
LTESIPSLVESLSRVLDIISLHGGL